MRRLVVLCRHGNTFNAGEKVVTVGAGQDLVLTAVGKAQAVEVGHALKQKGLSPQRIVAGPLHRTREFAEIVAELVGVSSGIAIDSRLTELDYGVWGGLSDDEIRQQWGDDVLRRWQSDGVRPKGVVFTPSEQQLDIEARAMLGELALLDGVTLVVTSNGRLREYARILSGVSSRVRTGHLCLLEVLPSGPWKVLCWDCEPAQLPNTHPMS
jgi:broad specificity phosphatase PhoE